MKKALSSASIFHIHTRSRLGRKEGFTIVELLIVIVIIAILAALIIVLYNGVQQRAENSKTISVVRQYILAVRAYAEDEGRYPSWLADDAGSNAAACLGEGYPLVAGSGRCGLQAADATSNYGLERAALNTKLRKYISQSQLPSPSLQSIAGSGQDVFVGALYIPSTNGVPLIWWWVAGSTSECGNPGLPTTVISNLPGGRRCRVALPEL